MFFDPEGNKGFIPNRLKRARREGIKGKGKENENVEPSVLEPANYPELTQNDIDSRLLILKNANPTDKKLIEVLMKETYHYRRTLTNNIYEHFPRFLDIPYLVSTLRKFK